MITAILIEQDPHVRRQIQPGEEILVEPPAADHVHRMLADAGRPHGEQSQSGGVLQFFAFQKRALARSPQTELSNPVSG